MSFAFLLMGAQAAGYGIDLYAKRQQQKMAGRGAELDKRQLDLQFQQEQLASTEAAYMNAERLREALASQRALFAARGQSSSQGTPLTLTAGQIGAFNADENARQISMSFRKHQLDAQKRLINIGLHTQKFSNKLDSAMKGINLLNFNGMMGGNASPNKLNKPNAKLNGPGVAEYRGHGGIY